MGRESRTGGRRLDVLLIDDDEDVYVIVHDMLEESPDAEYRLKWMPTYDRGLEALSQGRYDLCVVDYRLGTKTGLDLVRQAAQAGCAIPFVMLTGKGRLEIDIEAMQMGIADYVLKDELTPYLLDRTLRYALESARARKALETAKDDSQNLVDSSLDMIISVGPDRTIAECNPAALQGFGYPAEEMIGMPAEQLYADSEYALRVTTALAQQGRFAGEVMNRRKDGALFPSYLSASELRDRNGDVIGAMGISRDVTEQKEAEALLARLHGRLEESHHDLLTILNELRVGTAMTGENGQVVFVSESATQLLGKTAGECHGLPWHDLWPIEPDRKKRIAQMMEDPGTNRSRISTRQADAAIGWTSKSTGTPAIPGTEYCFSTTRPRFATCAKCSTRKTGSTISSGRANS